MKTLLILIPGTQELEIWQEWYVLNGQLYENSSNEIECNPMSSDGLQNFEIKLHPNPTSNYIYTNNNFRLEAEVFDIVGKLVMKEDFITKLDVSFLEKFLNNGQGFDSLLF